ncbi:MAG TPA: GNAT family N-acetyltransferase [Rhodothermales bacterium]|nr:GNAT family N-acetyltransferase [Rhodothermales bacterium]
MRLPQVIETERLRLRPPVAADAPFVFSYASDPAVSRYMTWRPHAAIGRTRAFLGRCRAVWDDGSAAPWLIERRADGVPVGMIEVRVEGPRAEVGYVVAPPHWGQGYAPEAVAAVCDLALVLPEVHRFWAVCDVENAASARVLEKAGLQYEGVLRRWLVHPNVADEPRDCHCYAAVR